MNWFCSTSNQAAANWCAEQLVILDDDDDDDNDNDDNDNGNNDNGNNDDDDDDDNDNDDNNDDDSNSMSGRGTSSDLNADDIGQELSLPPSLTTPYPISRPSSSRDPSLHPSVAPYNGCISRKIVEQPSYTTLILLDDEDNEIEKR